MRGAFLVYPALFALATSLINTVNAAKRPANSVLLSNIQTLTLRKDAKTSHRRVSPIPQLRCVGGNAKGLYEVDVMRCKNQGSDYDDSNIQWTCTASLPPEFKLGSTDVICEGYDSPDDPYILKGSCGVEYRLILTDLGEEKYGRGSGDLWRDFKRKGQVDWSAIIFWGIFIGVLGWIVYSAISSSLGRRGSARRLGGGGNDQPWGGGGGGGGGGWGRGGGGNDDPPPPYDYQPPSKSFPSASRTQRGSTSRQQQGWRPGFWTGALGGAAAGYFAGNRGRNAGPNTTAQGAGGSWFGGGRDVGEGSSRWGGGRQNEGYGPSRSASSSSSFSLPSSSRYESTGFGSTSRR